MEDIVELPPENLSESHTSLHRYDYFHVINIVKYIKIIIIRISTEENGDSGIHVFLFHEKCVAGSNFQWESTLVHYECLTTYQWLPYYER